MKEKAPNYKKAIMDKLAWTKYIFSIWISAILIALVARFVTGNPLVLVPAALGFYLVSLKRIARIKGY